MPDLCRKIPLLCVRKHEFFLPNRPFWRFLTPKNESAYLLGASLHGHFDAHRTISNPSDNVRLQTANICNRGCKRLRWRLQTFAYEWPYAQKPPINN